MHVESPGAVGWTPTVCGSYEWPVRESLGATLSAGPDNETRST